MTDARMHSEVTAMHHPLRAAIMRTSRTPSRSPSPPTTTTSSFDASLMPSTIYRRTLHSYSVHFSTQTGRWIATLAKVVDGEQQMDHSNKRCIQTFFRSEKEAKHFARAFTPPKMMSLPSSACLLCSCTFNARIRPHHCRNCGVIICDKCSARWGIKQVPQTYVLNSHALTVRVCKSCDWLSNAFCMALLQGKYEDAVKVFETGNVNLRSCFASINQEAMFPVHCAVLGANVELVKWLVDKHGCPISIKQDPRTGRLQSLQTSAGRSLVDLAMTGKPKLAVLRYLVMEKNLSVLDTKDAALAPRTLDALLRSGVSRESAEASVAGEIVHIIDDHTEHSGGTTLDDACILCYERSMDCVLIPCGHQVCCQECGKNLSMCPVCKVNCSVLRIFRHN